MIVRLIRNSDSNKKERAVSVSRKIRQNFSFFGQTYTKENELPIIFYYIFNFFIDKINLILNLKSYRIIFKDRLKILEKFMIEPFFEK